MIAMLTHLALSLITSSSITLCESPLAGADFSRHIAGPKVDAAWFAGKVVMLEYFGVN